MTTTTWQHCQDSRFVIWEYWLLFCIYLLHHNHYSIDEAKITHPENVDRHDMQHCLLEISEEKLPNRKILYNPLFAFSASLKDTTGIFSWKTVDFFCFVSPNHRIFKTRGWNGKEHFAAHHRKEINGVTEVALFCLSVLAWRFS